MAAKTSADLAYMGESDGSGMSYEFQVSSDQKSAWCLETTKPVTAQPNDRWIADHANWGATPSPYSTVALIVAVCVIDPPVTVIVTLPFSGAGFEPDGPPLPPPPHETAPNAKPNRSNPSKT